MIATEFVRRLKKLGFKDNQERRVYYKEYPDSLGYIEIDFEDLFSNTTFMFIDGIGKVYPYEEIIEILEEKFNVKRPLLVVIEGADNLGKSTYIKSLCEKFDFNKLQQPSGTGSLGFIRGIVKTYEKIDMFPRQLLHTCSHINDIHNNFNGENVIMDRCHISQAVYGRDLYSDELALLKDIHKSLYLKKLMENNYRVVIGIMTGDPYTGSDNSVYEKNNNWESYNNTYLSIQRDDSCWFLKSEEKVLISNIDNGREEFTKKIGNML